MTQAVTRLRAGFGRESITVYEPGTCTFGWGDIRRKIQGVARPLFARALVVEDTLTHRRVAYVCCDLGMISESVREAVVARLSGVGLGLDDHNVMITATHTHSGPSGFSTYFLYSSCAPGFSKNVHDMIVRGIVMSLMEAVAALVDARLHVHAEAFPLSAPVAWNRSIEAYSLNRDVTPLTFERRDEGVDRMMTVLRVDSAEGKPLGLVSWFAVHATSMHSQNQLLHGDNKGEASFYVESCAKLEQNPRFVAIFAQGAAGDVSPNFRFDPKRGLVVGRYEDDHESAVFSGELQAKHALSISKNALTAGTRIDGGLDAKIDRTDFFEAPVDADFAFGEEGHRTSPPRLGLHFACGTPEGPGPIRFARSWSRGAARVMAFYVRYGGPTRDDRLQGAKPTLMELAHGKRNRFLGLIEIPSRLFSSLPEGHLSSLGQTLRETDVGYQPWVPRMLPAQVLRLGPLIVLGMPNEPTVTTGRRVAAAIRKAVGKEAGYVIVNGYANAYASYVTTPEEYALQRYEGASTLYGEWSQPAWCTAFSTLVRSMRVSSERVSQITSQLAALPRAVHPTSPAHYEASLTR